MVTMI